MDLYILLLGAAALVVTANATSQNQERSDCFCLLDELDPDHVCTKTFEPVSYPKLGTFTADLPCHRRGFPPKDVTDIGTRFYLFTRDNRAASEELVDGGQSSGTNFSPARPTKFIIHGFTSSSERPWVVDMTEELLNTGDFNVITVDWRKGAERGSLIPDYCKARQNLRVVARQIVNLLKQLQAQHANLDLSDVHLIGHSLGGQMAGYVGKQLSGIGRISGIDPAKPEFQGYGTDCRLDPGDATFVDVIHASMYGIFQPVGHVDVYANYGTHMPGCPVWPDFLEGKCGHSKSQVYYIDSIRDQHCPALAYPCTWETGQGQGCTYRGQPGVDSVKMGYPADRTPASAYGSYTVMTNKERPFCAPDIVPE